VVSIVDNAAAKTLVMPALLPCFQKPAHIDVRQQRREYPALRRAPVAGAPLCPVAAVPSFHWRLQPHPDQMQYGAVRYPTRNRPQPCRIRNRVEGLRQVGIDHMKQASLETLMYSPNSLLSASPWTVTVRVAREIRREDWLQDQFHRRLHDPIFDGGNAQRTFATIRLWDHHP